MEALRNMMPWKKAGDRDHSSWRNVRATWYKMVFSDCIITRDFSSPEYKKWNPWKDWCKSWEEFQSSEKKPPKSDMPKAALFSELSTIAKLTSDKLEEAKAMRTYLEQKTNENESLRNQNSFLKKKCEELQCKLDETQQVIIENDLLNNYNLEKQVNLRQALQAQKDYLTLEVCHKEQDLKKAQSKCEELKKTVSSLQGQLVEFRGKDNLQVNIKNDIFIVPGLDHKWKPSYGQLENGEGEKSLHLDYIRDIVGRLGKVTSLNVFDWLCNFEEEYKISHLSEKDFEQILRRCMDPSSFSSLPLPVRRGQITWLNICKRIAERFIPDLDDMMNTETMREDDTVLQYFHRMWMIYRISEYDEFVSRDDSKYKNAICEGLSPHLSEEVEYLYVTDYEDIERAALLAEHSWLECEKSGMNWYQKTRKAGAGCPSRMKIWKRLEKYAAPYEEINNAPYWKLVVYLSRFEDLETGAPR